MGFPPIAELVPHRPPMLLIDEVIAFSDRKVTCRTKITGETPFVRANSVSTVLAIELFAQSAAALVGLLGRMRGGTAQTTGALLGTRELALLEPELAVGDELTIECEESLTIDAAAQIECRLLRGDTLIARGSINVYAGDLR